jgi:hypothetical protein
MSHRFPATVAAIAISIAACRPSTHAEPALRATLATRTALDQAAIRDQAAHFGDSTYENTKSGTLLANAAWLDSVVSHSGWPGFSRVDSGGSHDAFLIAQHADAVPDKQQRFLTALRAAVAAHDARPQDLAYLEDRVRKSESRPQLYGTQPAYDSSGNAVQPPVESPERLDTRRAGVGLPPMAQYLEQMRALNAQLRALQTAASKLRVTTP